MNSTGLSARKENIAVGVALLCDIRHSLCHWRGIDRVTDEKETGSKINMVLQKHDEHAMGEHGNKKGYILSIMKRPLF